MAFSSVAIVVGVTTLASSLFKRKQLRTSDIFKLLKINNGTIENKHLLKIAENDINAHITGIKDPIYHKALLEIMAKHNKPVDYFGKLDGRLSYSGMYQIITIKNKPLPFIKKQLKDVNSPIASFVYLLILLIILKHAIEIDSLSILWMQAAAIILAGLAGIIFSHLIMGLSVQWNKNTYQLSDSEYQNMFNEYANEMHKMEPPEKNIISQE